MEGSVDVFISYAHDDEGYLRELEEHLAVLKRDGDIRAWHQRLVLAGGEPRSQSEERLRAARIVVLLVSASYVASDYLHDHEMTPALERGRNGTALVIPVLVRAHDWEHAPYSHLEILPRSKVPVEGWPRRDDAWAEVATEIREVVEKLGGGQRARPRGAKVAVPKPRYEDAESRELATQLDDARARRRALTEIGAETVSVDQEILDLRRRLREGGRLRAGDTLGDGRYRLIEPLGRGGFALVWSAFDRERGERVAVKVLHAELAGDPQRRERFFRGARVMAGLGHEAVVRVLCPQGEDAGHLFFVMELVPGGDLQHAVLKGRVPREGAVPILLGIGEALAEAHAKGIVHRDVKPANILLDGAGTPRLTDFDLVTAGDTTGGTRTGAAMGSWLYMAPEQRRDAKQADARADVYALGMTAVFCLHGGELPDVREAQPEEVIAGLDCAEAIKTVLARAIAVSPGKRYADGRAFCEALRAAAAPAPEVAPAPTRTETGSSSEAPLLFEHAFPESVSAQSERAERVGDANRVNGDFEGTPGRFEHFERDPERGSPRPSKLVFAAPDPRDAIDDGLARRSAKRPHPLVRAVMFGGAAAAMGGIGFTVWMQLVKVPPPQRIGTSSSASVDASTPDPAVTATATSTSRAPAVEAPMPAWMALVRDGQQAIAAGDYNQAQRLFKDAKDKSGGHGVPQTLGDHITAATAPPSSSSIDYGSCRLTGLARPRTYDLVSTVRSVNAGRPSIAVGAYGAVVTWTDAHEGGEHAYAVALDDTLRNTGAPVDVTPEGVSVGHPELDRAGERLLLTYGDGRGPEAGVHVRFLDADGRIAGPAVQVAPPKLGTYSPSLAAAPDGSFYVAWSDESDNHSEDLFLRHLAVSGNSLALAGDVVRVTDLVPPGRPRARLPSIAVAGNALLIAYRHERDPLRLIEHLRLPLADAANGLGPPPKKGERKDRTIGDVALVNSDKSKADSPSLACGGGACFLVWHVEHVDPDGGAWAAYIDPAAAQPVLRRRFSQKGSRPAVAVTATGQAQVAWYEDGKILTASMTRDGMGAPTHIARGSTDLVAPSITAGSKPGEWYLAWLDYEAAHVEAYAARVQCK